MRAAAHTPCALVRTTTRPVGRWPSGWWRLAALAGLLVLGGCTPRWSIWPTLPAARPPVTGSRDDDPYWLLARKESAVTALDLPTPPGLPDGTPDILPRKILHGAPNVRNVALTFDDGPHPRTTLRLLTILRHYGVPATFFVVGKMVERYPELLRAEDAEGFLIGNHTFHHVNLTHLSPVEIRTELLACNLVVHAVIGKEMRFYRPPGGDVNADVIDTAASMAMTTVLWSDDPADYANPGDQVLMDRLLAHVADGSIILLHDGPPETLEILPRLIETLQRMGYHFQTVAEMAATH